MLEYYLYTQDPTFLEEYVYPYADAVLDWWIYHYPPSLAGQVIITPGQAIETFQGKTSKKRREVVLETP
jgi:hypothetical protein